MSKLITKNDLTNIFNEVLPPVGSKVLYSGDKVSSGTITLLDAYTNYDFLHISYVINSDRFTKVFDCSALTANPTSTWTGDVSIYGTNNVTYMSDCYFTVTDSTHLSVSNTGNNANFIAGIYKIVGITSHTNVSSSKRSWTAFPTTKTGTGVLDISSIRGLWTELCVEVFINGDNNREFFYVPIEPLDVEDSVYLYLRQGGFGTATNSSSCYVTIGVKPSSVTLVDAIIFGTSYNSTSIMRVWYR